MRVIFFLLSFVFAGQALAQDKPNMLIIWGDDIGFWNLSTNNMGMMGYDTPNIDRIAEEGAKFTDYYGQQSCTAGRSAFILGQSPIRTGLTKVGSPVLTSVLGPRTLPWRRFSRTRAMSLPIW